ncbi:hypothetical protein [Viridibacillus arvi]|uniref:hypothetical protein n=1 Tax=Viridibacillus arvi TaxID=263475 RepID=UPI0034CFC1F9
MKKLIWIVLLYPILWVIDYLSDSQLLQTYHSFLISYWKLVIIGFITYYIYIKTRSFANEELEDMRERQYLSEAQRYYNTPFVPPITMMYLLNPPIAFSNYDIDNVNNTFYRTVVNSFRDNVYRMVDYPETKPMERKPFSRVVGFKRWSRFSAYTTIPLSWLGYWLVRDPAALLHGWQLFSLPFVFIALLRGVYILQAISTHLPSLLDIRLRNENVLETLYTWREVFPDCQMGIVILRAYEAEKESRMRYEYIARCITVPSTTEHYANATFPPYPYPSPSIPEWSEDMEFLIQERLKDDKTTNKAQLKQMKNSSNGNNIIHLNAKKR